MLVEFRVENHRSIRDEQTFTMTAAPGGDEGDPRPRRVHGCPERLLPVSVLYGANASGKSNVLDALAFMRFAVVASHRAWAPEQGVPRDPFAWGPTRSEPSMFEAVILIDGVRYQFGFAASDQCFLEEWLFAWPRGKKQVWYERDNDAYKFGENLKGENKLVEEVTRPNALFLSSAAQHKHAQLRPIFSWFQSLRWLRTSPTGNLSIDGGNPSEFELARLRETIRQPTPFDEEPSINRLRDRFRRMLTNADIGILDARQPKDASFRDRIQLKHKTAFGDAWLPLKEESKGTQMLFRIALPILQTIDEGGFVAIDELEASLHPSLAQSIVRLFNDPESNPKNAQMLFTTHDTNLLGTTLGEPTLRRDQVWLTEKDAEGATVLYPLTDYKPRKAENLERGYLQGRYGAIPFLGNFTVTSE